MKKYLIFIVSFILFFSLFFMSAEILFGMFLTATYTPDINEAWNQSATLPGQVDMISSSNPFFFTLLLAFLAGTIAYFIYEKFSKRVQNKEDFI